MITNCIICDKKIEKEFESKIDELIPNVCSTKCFLDFLNIMKIQNFYDLIAILKTEKIAVQELKHKSAFKSKAEHIVAEFLDSLNIKWEYEKYAFFGVKLTSYKYQPMSNRYYIPDFFLKDYNIFVEIKDKEILNNKARALFKVIPIIILTPKFILKIKEEK